MKQTKPAQALELRSLSPVLGTYSKECSWLKALQEFQDGGSQWLERFKSVAA